jgi:low affinity Fe/Cu permease
VQHGGELPSHVTDEIGLFDRFATRAAALASRAPFFALSVALVVAWLVQGVVTVLVTGDWGRITSSTYQLEINTTTTIVTFLLVALLQNTQTRHDQALQHKLNALADGLADLMEHTPSPDTAALSKDIEELRLAVGLEERETSTNHDDARAAHG